jgi:hypothetical protein
MSDWPRYLVTALREEGRLAQLAGDYAGARESYDRYLRYRTAPEDELAPVVEQVRRLRSSLP